MSVYLPKKDFGGVAVAAAAGCAPGHGGGTGGGGTKCVCGQVFFHRGVVVWSGEKRIDITKCMVF